MEFLNNVAEYYGPLKPPFFKGVPIFHFGMVPTEKGIGEEYQGGGRFRANKFRRGQISRWKNLVGFSQNRLEKFAGLFTGPTKKIHKK